MEVGTVILYDPTECRRGSRLPKEVVAAGRPLVGLERMTGADLLITRNKLPMKRVMFDMPRPLLDAFRLACKNGALIQRKSGLDLVSSLSDFNEILRRMLDWSPEPWLVSTGVVKEKRGKVWVDGRLTKVRYTSYQSKVTWWQRRGGYWVHFERDEHLVPWIARWQEGGWLEEQEDRRVIKRTPVQSLVPGKWYDKLTAVHNIGPKVAKSVGEWMPEGHRNVASALSYLSNFKGNYRKNNHPPGVGRGTFLDVQQWLGLDHDHALGVTEVPEVKIVEAKE